MNLGEPDLRSVQHNRPQMHRVNTSELPITPTEAQIDDCPSLTSSISENTVIRWVTPPSRHHSPEGSPDTTTPGAKRDSVGINEAAYASNAPLVVRFDEDQIRSDEVQSSKKVGRMDGIVRDQGPPTPIDDTPYIRFAIDQLTRDEDVRAAQRQSTAASSDSYPVDRIVPDHGLGYISTRREELALTRKHRSTPEGERERLFNFNATRPLSNHSAPSVNIPNRKILSAGPEFFVHVEPPLHTPRYPLITFVPTILRTKSMITLSILCFLMIVALAFCAIYSTTNDGLTEYSGGLYGGRYFLFGFLPQVIAACIFVYVQCVMSAMTRVMPYTMLAMEEAESRANSLFLGMFPRTILFPRWEGPSNIRLANLLFWFAIFTIPLQSCLFSVVQVDGVWRWMTVQGVAWTLVTIYVFILLAAIISVLFFFNRTTGLMWDPRSLADTIAMLPRSNCLKDYSGTDVMDKNELRDRLSSRSDRLGYWITHHQRTQGIFHCIAEPGESIRRYTLESGRISEKTTVDVHQSSDIEQNAGSGNRSRFDYISWYLRDTFVIFWAVAGFLTLLALIIVSFLPSTAIRDGFSPLVSPAANSAGFSPANFLYSFIPSVLGMLLYSFFQSLEMGIRKLQPWAELRKPQGARAEKSLLLDYTAALPVKCTLDAFDCGHYRVAVLSLLSTLFLLLPVLAGGLFFPLTTPSNEVRMIPNLPSFYICITLLILYTIGLFIMLPYRRLMHLPHDVDCLAEIISFVYGSRILNDAAFRAPRSKADLVTRLLSAQVGGLDSRYAFGQYKTQNGQDCIGVERLGRQGVQVQV